MWEKTHSTTARGLTPAQVWAVWSDINNRHAWDLDTEWATLKGPFVTGAVFKFKPKGGPKLSMTITECTVNKSFTDCFKVPCARLHGTHSMEETMEGLKITTTIRITGPLGFLLRKIIGEKVAAEVPEQTAMLIKLAKEIRV